MDAEEFRVRGRSRVSRRPSPLKGVVHARQGDGRLHRRLSDDGSNATSLAQCQTRLYAASDRGRSADTRRALAEHLQRHRSSDHAGRESRRPNQFDHVPFALE